MDEIIEKLKGFAMSRPERVCGTAVRGEAPHISYFVEKVDSYCKISEITWDGSTWSEPHIIFEGDLYD